MQRRLLVRLGQEVEEVLRAIGALAVAKPRRPGSSRERVRLVVIGQRDDDMAHWTYDDEITVCGVALRGNDRPEARDQVFHDRDIEPSFDDVFEEQCIRVGERVSAVGLARVEPGPPVSTTYRNAPSSMLVLRAAPDQKLLIAGPETIWRDDRGAYLVGWISMGLGLAALLAGAIMHLDSGQ